MEDGWVVISTPDRRIPIGRLDEVRAAAQAIADVTGGSSARGAWSLVFGLIYAGEPEVAYREDALVGRVSAEASDMLARIGEHLRPDAVRLLERLAALT